MDKKLFELGLSKRKATLGKEYVQKNLDAADDFNEDFQKQMTEWCWHTRVKLLKKRRRRK
jgi:4-carboxymuconolactone decarboxylase